MIFRSIISRAKSTQSHAHIHKPMYLNKSKGQHLLTNPRVLDTIIRKSEIKPTDTVLEIGPGTGNLTVRLLEAAKRVVTFEVDKRMVDAVTTRARELGFEDKISVVHEDALKAKFPEFDLVVANIPYNISSPLVTKLVYGKRPFRSATLLLQQEFARRLLAKPGDSEYNRLAVNVSVVANVELVMDVSKRDFIPPPKVDSSVVIIRPKEDKLPELDLDEWRAFTLTCFGKKNKTLGAIFKQKKKVIDLMGLSGDVDGHSNDNHEDQIQSDDLKSENERPTHVSSFADTESRLFKEKIVRILKESGFEDQRPSKLCNEELFHLLSLLNRAGIYFHRPIKGNTNQ